MARTPKVVEDRREQIIDAAMRVFARKGFARATNKDIAREASITPGLIYHYFTSKEDLLMAVIEARSPLQFITNLPAEITMLAPEQFFQSVLLRVLNIFEEEPFVHLLPVLFSETLHDGSGHVGQIIPTILPRAITFISTYIEKKIATGELRSGDPTLAAQTLAGCLISFMIRRVILRDPMALAYTHEQIVDAIIDLGLRGLLPR